MLFRSFLRLLAPFTFVMSRLKYAQKFILTSILFAVPLVLVLGLWLQAVQSDIGFAREERKGVTAIQSVMPLLLKFQQHGALVEAYINGDETAKAQIAANEQEIEKQISSAGTDIAETGFSRTAAALQALKPEWEKLQADTQQLTLEESLSRHTGIIGKAGKLIKDTADESKLTLDPELDSFYMMDIMVNRAPDLIELTGRVLGMGNQLLIRNQISEAEKMDVNVIKSQMETAGEGIQTSLLHIYDSNTAWKSELDQSGNQSLASTKAFVSLINDKLIKDTQLSMKPEEFYPEGLKTVNDIASLFAADSDTLFNLLSGRISHLENSRNTILAITLAAAVLIVLFYIAFYRNVKVTVQLIQGKASKMAAGDFSGKLTVASKDELADIGTSFNLINDSLNELLRRNQDLSEQLTASSEELTAVSTESAQAMEHIAKAIQSVSDGNEIQNRASGEISGALTEMAIGVQRIAENAGEVVGSAAHAVQNAEEGARQLKAAVDQMRTIQSSVIDSGKVIGQLGELSEQIDFIVAAIVNISSQTQLLSLNANIEAARAGEHGRGFMVVASEVSKLAEQTTTSVKSISEVIGHIRGLVDQSIQSVEVTSREADNGLKSIHAANGSIDTIMGAIQLVTEQIQEVSAAAEEMSASSQQVSASVSEVAAISRQNAGEAETIAAGAQQQLASMQEIQASAATLSSNALQLQDDLGRFTLE
ncbi:methyl-accepting chemotaxis protein [Paenibacillus sp. BR2-3]|uniref:methyl-accepting chemotaxis protein n=1 Tax=Paenibacillus sp. BR2-3 TaxID=3048494 RepID=UPI003977B8BF